MTIATPPALRREFDLPEDDVEALDARGLPWETVIVTEGGKQALWLFVHEFPLPPGYTDRSAPTPEPLGATTLGIRVTGYPGGALDMAYFHPPLRRVDGRAIGAVGDITIDGKTFQQWSRHYTPANPFRPGIDTIATHLGLVEEWLAREFRR